MMHLLWHTWMVAVFFTRSSMLSSYQAPYVDIEGLPPMSYYEPGDVNVAYMAGFSSRGRDGKLCRGTGVYGGSFKSTEAAR